VYSDEILYQAGIHPETAVDLVSEEDLKKLYRVMRRVLRVATEKQADVDRMPRGYILPHRKEGDRCPRCGGRVDKKNVSGRSSYYCPSCQKKK
jgi:formamidopyrimidine-DNA glycosylase